MRLAICEGIAVFDAEWLADLIRLWNGEKYAPHHPRFCAMGRVAICVSDSPAQQGCLLQWDASGRLECAQPLADAALVHDVPTFHATAATWHAYKHDGRSAAYYFALGQMQYRGDPIFLIRRGLAFDILARCAGEVDGG